MPVDSSILSQIGVGGAVAVILLSLVFAFLGNLAKGFLKDKSSNEVSDLKIIVKSFNDSQKEVISILKDLHYEIKTVAKTTERLESELKEIKKS